MNKQEIYNTLKDNLNNTAKLNGLLEKLKEDILLEELPSISSKQRIKKCLNIVKGFSFKGRMPIFSKCDYDSTGRQMMTNSYIAVALVKEDEIPGIERDITGRYPKIPFDYKHFYNITIDVNKVKQAIKLSEEVFEVQTDEDEKVYFDPKLLLNLLILLNLQNERTVTLSSDKGQTVYTIKKDNGSIGLIGVMRRRRSNVASN